MLPPILHFMPRVRRDIEECVDFISRQPWGKPHDRKSDIKRGIFAICASPHASRPELFRPESGLWLRRCRAAQFVIVYVYLPTVDLSEEKS